MDRRSFLASMGVAAGTAAAAAAQGATVKPPHEPMAITMHDGMRFIEGAPPPFAMPPLVMVPLRGCRYDTEIYDPEQPTTELYYFQRALGQAMAYPPKNVDVASLNWNSLYAKGEGETNQNMPGMLEYPLELRIEGFSFFVEPLCLDSDYAEIVKNGLLTFNFMSRRRWQRPLRAMPRNHTMTMDFSWLDLHDKIELLKKSREYAAGATQEERDAFGQRLNELVAAFNKVTPMDRYMACKFDCGGEHMIIKPGEYFGMKLSWSEPPKTSRPLRLTAAIEGYVLYPL